MSERNGFIRFVACASVFAALLSLVLFDSGCGRRRVRTGPAVQPAPAQGSQPRNDPAPEPEPAPAPGGETDNSPAPGPAPAAGEGDITVEADGEGESRDEALNDAFRKAVEKGAGVEITSRTETVDYAVAFDRIITRARGYVKSHRILSDKTTRFESRIRIEAVVSQKSIRDDWGQIQMVLERVGRPTVIVLVDEKVIGQDNKGEDSGTAYCATAIENLLLQKGFNLKSSTAMQEIEKRRKEAALATSDLAALKAIALSYGADVMFVGKAVSRFNGNRPIHGVPMDEYTASGSITVYKADTGDVMVKESFDTRCTAQGEGAAIAGAYGNLSKQMAAKTLKALLEKWYFEFQHGSEIALELGITSDYPDVAEKAASFATRFVSLLKGIRGVTNVIEGQLTTTSDKAIQSMRVSAKLSAAELAKKIGAMDTTGAGFGLSVSETKQHSIGVALKIGGESKGGGGEENVENPEPDTKPSKLGAETGETVVRAKGEGADKNEAVNDALRKAVEKGAGLEITSRTETVDYAVAFDRIVSRSQGYVRKYEIVDEKQGDYNFSVEIEAIVSTGKIKDDWGQIQLILERAGRPTVMVLVAEKVFGKDNKAQESETDYCASAIESLLIEKGFSVKSAKGMDEIQRRKKEAALASGDLGALKAIAVEFGANVMITGTSTARWNGEKDAYGALVYSYMANASVKVHKADTGDLMMSLNFDKKEDAMGPAEAITKAFKGIGSSLSDKVLKDLLRRWYFEFQHGASIEIEVIVKAASKEKLSQAARAIAKISELFKSIRGVDSIVEKSLSTFETEARQKMDVKAKLTAADLKKQILFLDVQGTGFSLAVTAADQNTIQITLTLD